LSSRGWRSAQDAGKVIEGHGKHVVQDEGQAFRWLERLDRTSSERGRIASLADYGIFACFGRGVSCVAERLFRVAIDLILREACP
jgi:hypothetical protein